MYQNVLFFKDFDSVCVCVCVFLLTPYWQIPPFLLPAPHLHQELPKYSVPWNIRQVDTMTPGWGSWVPLSFQVLEVNSSKKDGTYTKYLVLGWATWNCLFCRPGIIKCRQFHMVRPKSFSCKTVCLPWLLINTTASPSHFDSPAGNSFSNISVHTADRNDSLTCTHLANIC